MGPSVVSGLNGSIFGRVRLRRSSHPAMAVVALNFKLRHNPLVRAGILGQISLQVARVRAACSLQAGPWPDLPDP